MKFLQRAEHVIRTFQDASPAPRQRPPEVLQFPINDICNSRCQMCQIWQQKRDTEITPMQTRQVLSNPLFRHVQTIGINGGEPTLRRDIGDLVNAVVTTLPKLRGLALITNAIIPKRVISAIDEIGAICLNNGVHLDVMVSLDGVGELHDRVRGRPGNFETAVAVLEHLSTSPVIGSYRIGCTVIKENVYGVEDLLNWCQRRDIYARFRIGIPHKRLYSRDVTAPFTLDDDELFHFANFLDYLYYHYEQSETRKAFYRSLRDQLVYDAPRTAGCAWRSKGATLSPRGELLYCAVESDALGNAITEDAEALYWENSDHLKDIVTNRCDGCLHDYEGVADRRVYLKHLLQRQAARLPGPARAGVAALARMGVRIGEARRINRARRNSMAERW